MTHLKNRDGQTIELRQSRACHACVNFVPSSKSEGRGMCALYNQIVGSTDECAEFRAQGRNRSNDRVQRA